MRLPHDEPGNMRISPELLGSLEQWLEIATRGLCDDAKERVRAEIESHYADAVAASMERGLSVAEAHGAAMASLGNPRKSRRAFHRAYLTRREFKQLQDIARTRWYLLVGYSLMLLTVWMEGARVPELVGLACLLGVSYVLGVLLARHWMRQGAWRKAIAADTVLVVPVSAFMVLQVALQVPGLSPWAWHHHLPAMLCLFLAALGILWVLVLHQHAVLWIKAGKSKAERVRPG